MKTKSAAWRLLPQLHYCKFSREQKNVHHHQLRIVNSFRGDYYYVLLPVSGDTECEVHIAAIATNVPCMCWDTVKSEACIKPFGKKKSSVLANPYRGNEASQPA